MSQPKREGILAFLDFNSHLKTPVFQRTFAWEKPQINDYWTDLRRALDAPKGPDDYFLGLVVLDNADQIQDGQQRLATTLLMASELHDLIQAAKNVGAHNAQLAIDAEAQVTPALRQSPGAPLVISSQDQSALLSRAGIRSDAPESTKRLAAARKQIRGYLEADLASKTTADSKLARLKSWGEFLRSEAYTVLLRVPERDAHNIFETLNTRGVRLSNGDLAKSHLVSRASDTSLAVTKWNDVTNALKDGKGRYEADLESFLFHYYGSRYRRTTRSEFFADFRQSTESTDALTILDELIASAKLYRALTDPAASAVVWDEIGPDTQQAVELVNALNLKQLRFLLLAVLRDWTKPTPSKADRKRQREAILKITAWSIRGVVHGQIGGGEAERTYISAARDIRDGKIKTVSDLKAHFVRSSMLITDDTLFKTRFREFAWDRRTSHQRARAVLYALEYHKIPSKSGLKPRDTLTVEHVLPQSPAPGTWSDFSPTERSAYTYNLGNLLLIDGPSGANDKLANKEWPAKKALIRQWGTQTPLTAEALKRVKWNKVAVDRRNEALADLAVKAWSA